MKTMLAFFVDAEDGETLAEVELPYLPAKDATVRADNGRWYAVVDVEWHVSSDGTTYVEAVCRRRSR